MSTADDLQETAPCARPTDAQLCAVTTLKRATTWPSSASLGIHPADVVIQAIKTALGSGWVGFVLLCAFGLLSATVALAASGRRALLGIEAGWIGVATQGFATAIFTWGSYLAALGNDAAHGTLLSKAALAFGVLPALAGVIATAAWRRRPLRHRTPRERPPSLPPLRRNRIAATVSLALVLLSGSLALVMSLRPLLHAKPGKEHALGAIAAIEAQELNRGCSLLEQAKQVGFDGANLPAWPGATRMCFELRFEESLTFEGSARRARLEAILRSELAPTPHDRTRVEQELSRIPSE